MDFQWENQLGYPREDRIAAMTALRSWGVRGTTLSLMNIDGLPDHGVNVLTATYEQRDEWRRYLEWLAANGIKRRVYLTELEHKGTLTLSQMLDVVDLAQGIVGDTDTEIVLGEEWDFPPEEGEALAEWVRLKIPGRRITIVNPMHTGNFDATVARLAPQGLLDGVLIQSAAADLEWRAAEWREMGLWSVAFEELNGTTPWGLPGWIRASNQAGCREWSVYTAYDLPLSPLCNDLDARDPRAYESALRAATGTATGFVLW